MREHDSICMPTGTTRRSFLGTMAALPLPAAKPSSRPPPDIPPTRKELEHYYSFLWLELIALSKEMDVEMHCNSVMHRSGGRDAYQLACSAGAPSTRARAILAIRDA